MEELRQFTTKHVKTKVTLIGGMVKCKGLVERMKMEFPELEFYVDENLLWKCAAKYLLNKK